MNRISATLALAQGAQASTTKNPARASEARPSHFLRPATPGSRRPNSPGANSEISDTPSATLPACTKEKSNRPINSGPSHSPRRLRKAA